jgi:putative inorganic carbon (hco3(-)) transporter
MLQYGEGIEITQEVMASAGLKVIALVLIVGLCLYLYWRLKGYDINFILFMIIYLFPTSNLFFDVGFHLFYHRILLILYGVFFLFKKLTSKEKGGKLLNATTVAAALFLFFSLPGLAAAYQIGAFLRFWLAFLSGLLLFMFILDDIKNPRRLEGYVIACVSSGLVWAVVGLWLFFTGNVTLMVQDVNFLYRLSSLCGDANFFASIMVGWLPLGIYGFLRRGGKEKSFYLLATGAITLAITFTYSRGAYLALSGVALFNVFLFFKYGSRLSSIFSKGKTFTAFLIAVIIIFVMFIKIASVGSRVVSIESDKTGGSGRLAIWVDMLKVGLRNPLGVGLGNLTIYTAKNRSEYQTAGSVAHNVFLNIFAETGFLGLILFLVFIISILNKYFIAGNFQSNELLYLFLAIYSGMLGIFITMIFLSNIYNENIFVQGALLLSVIYLDRK